MIMSTFAREAETLSMSTLSVVLIGPDGERRARIAQALEGPQATITHELLTYPHIDDLAPVIDNGNDVLVVDLDPDPERALDVVDNVCSSRPSLTVMAYSAKVEPELLVRCMRAGAREFLSEPISPITVSEALVRAAVRRDEVRRQRKVSGKLLVFVGAKGGVGVTTVAVNFAVAVARQSGDKVTLADFNLHLGDAALTLGLASKFSIADAFENAARLDSDFLSVLLQRHRSGLMVLPAPDRITTIRPSQHSIDKLVRIMTEEFAYVVVDAGSNGWEHREPLLEAADSVYLVAQAGVGELRNANRLVSTYFSGAQDKLEIVLNRFAPKIGEFDEATISKALTRSPKWRVPNDFAAVRRAQNTGIPIASEENGISRVFTEMARAACGQPQQQTKKRKFGLF